MKKLLFYILFLAAAGGLGWLVWLRPLKAAEEEKKPEAEVPVHTGQVVKTNLHGFITAYGIVEAAPSAGARIGVGVPGLVTAVHCVEGAKVEQGAILFEIDQRPAAVVARFADQVLERQRKLAQSENTSQKAVQDAESQAAAAHAQLAILEIRSPIAGIVTRLNTRAGEAVDLTSILAEVADPGRLVVNLIVPGPELAELKAGQSVELASPDATNAVPAAVSLISPGLDAKTGAGWARVPLPAGAGWRPGQFIKGRVASSEHRDCLAVPLTSVARDPSGAAYVELVDGGKAVLKPVKTGLRDGDWIEVEGEGIEAGKTVVTEGAYGLIMTQQFATKIRVVND